MKINSSKLYENYSVYLGFRKKEGRMYVTMVHKETKKHRLMAYARYIFSSHIGRELCKNESVDHIDENKTNDSIENLQLLTTSENIKKNKKFRGIEKEYINATCYFCGKIFKQEARQIRSRKKAGCKKIFCSRSCCGHETVRIRREKKCSLSTGIELTLPR